MLMCPRCGADGVDIKTLHRSPIEPAEDKFSCNRCEKVWCRYDYYNGISSSEEVEPQNNCDYDVLAKAFVSLLDGQADPAQIKRLTGLPDKRCQEIYELYQKEVKRLYP